MLKSKFFYLFGVSFLVYFFFGQGNLQCSTHTNEEREIEHWRKEREGVVAASFGSRPKWS